MACWGMSTTVPQQQADQNEKKKYVLKQMLSFPSSTKHAIFFPWFQYFIASQKVLLWSENEKAERGLKSNFKIFFKKNI